MRFAIGIPNYNYAHYIGRTAVVEGFRDPRVHVARNACNVGFAGNLDRAAAETSAPWMIMLSSDDLVRPSALSTYARLFALLGDGASRAVASSAMEVIDPDDVVKERIPIQSAWRATDVDQSLSSALGATVYRVPARELLKRSLATMQNPLNFASTCYPRALYEKVGGYGGGRLLNPDKWFHWRLLSVADDAFFVDAALFQYRWHPKNQTAIQAATGSLKLLVDDYASTLELDKSVIDALGLSRDDLAAAFVEHDIVRHGLATLGRGDRARARRIVDFGRAAYPDAVRASVKARALSALLAFGPVGEAVAKRAYRWKFREGRGYRAAGQGPTIR
jgi:hypothetical protein